MLDFAHKLILRGVERGREDGSDPESPALRTLVETGLATRGDDGGYAITDAGRAALEASEPSRWERVFLLIFALSGVVVAVGIVIDWVS